MFIVVRACLALDEVLGVEGLREPLVERHVVVRDARPGVQQEQSQVCINQRIARLSQHVLNHVSVQRALGEVPLVEPLGALEPCRVYKAHRQLEQVSDTLASVSCQAWCSVN